MTPRPLLRALVRRSAAARPRTPGQARAPFRIRKHREKNRRFPPTQVGLFRAQTLAAGQASRFPRLRLFPPTPPERNLRGRECGLIATTAGWCSARTIGFIFGRTFSSGIESPLPKPIPSPLALLSMAPSGSGALAAAYIFLTEERATKSRGRNWHGARRGGAIARCDLDSVENRRAASLAVMYDIGRCGPRAP